MDVTEVRIMLRNKESNKKLKAYATVTFDSCFVVRDVKVIEGSKGLFVAMPSSKMKVSCPKCGHRNVVRSHFCSQCGNALEQPRAAAVSEENRQSEHKDIAHPITPECREYIQKRVLEEYDKKAKEPGAGQTSESSSAADFSCNGEEND